MLKQFQKKDNVKNDFRSYYASKGESDFRNTQSDTTIYKIHATYKFALNCLHYYDDGSIFHVCLQRKRY